MFESFRQPPRIDSHFVFVLKSDQSETVIFQIVSIIFNVVSLFGSEGVLMYHLYLNESSIVCFQLSLSLSASERVAKERRKSSERL